MTDVRTQAELDQRWDIHTGRQIAASKGGVAAVTLLNSGSWLALLTQADKLAVLNNDTGAVATVVLCWGLGAFFGTLTWLFVYLSTLAQAQHDFQRDKHRHLIALEVARWLGLLCVFAALGLFVGGVFALSGLLT
ncbi:MAG: hypothetical protein Q8K33_03430 [Cypionkella sp.]|uniref:hypothetical protein n=1 Tax=Cypionkella sp. TaxID=2811411 RepID=UPI00272EFBFC|nr:hypothetical protein [Cypionkella sp.]MDP2047932.1 hypothetical protein [Cypionkella sp.]